MPFWFGGMWFFPMFLMPIIVLFIFFSLHKSGYFKNCMNSMQENNNSEIKSDFHLKEDSNNSKVLEIIKERYAKGEISTEEYKEMKEELLKY